jgi:hypothetical protein
MRDRDDIVERFHQPTRLNWGVAIMTQKSQTWTSRAYRVLLRVLPFDFPLIFGRDMERTSRDQTAATQLREGKTGLLRLWLETVVGVFRIAPREHWQLLRQDTR